MSACSACSRWKVNPSIRDSNRMEYNANNGGCVGMIVSADGVLQQ
jgi:hypothetical protein